VVILSCTVPSSNTDLLIEINVKPPKSWAYDEKAAINYLRMVESLIRLFTF